MKDISPGYWPILPMEMPWVPLQYMSRTTRSVLLDLGEKQSSPMSTQARWMLTWETLRESKKSLFFGGAFAGLVDTAVQATSLSVMCCAVLSDHALKGGLSSLVGKQEERAELTVNKKSSPTRRVLQMDTSHLEIGEVLGVE